MCCGRSEPSSTTSNPVLERRWPVRLHQGRVRFRQYDNVYSSFFISYVRPIHRSYGDAAGEFQIAYPLQFSVGLQAEQFPSFTGTAQSGTLIRPVFRLSIF